jgi:hypothetical protein
VRRPAVRWHRDAQSDLVAAATAPQRAFAAGDAPAAAADLLHTDVVLADMSLRAQLTGRIETARYLTRVLADVPYGQSSSLRHVVGGTAGGRFEWTAGPGHDGLARITAIELDASQLITSVTSVYDSRQLPPARKAALTAASIEP